MTIVEALNLRAAFANIKCQLAEAGVDISDVKTVSDLPNVLATILPAELVPELEKRPEVKMIMENGWLVGFLNSFIGEAKGGILVKGMVLGSDQVSEDDLNA